MRTHFFFFLVHAIVTFPDFKETEKNDEKNVKKNSKMSIPKYTLATRGQYSHETNVIYQHSANQQIFSPSNRLTIHKIPNSTYSTLFAATNPLVNIINHLVRNCTCVKEMAKKLN